ANGEANRLDSSGGGFSEEVLELGEDLFNGVQVGRVFGQEEELSSCGADELTHDFASVAAEIVHDHDVARTQRWQEDLLHVEAKAAAVDRSLEKPRRLNSVMAQSRQEGHGLPAAVRNFGGEPAPAWRPSPQRCHVGSGPGLVDEDQAGRVKPPLIL